MIIAKRLTVNFFPDVLSMLIIFLADAFIRKLAVKLVYGRKLGFVKSFQAVDVFVWVDTFT